MARNTQNLYSTGQKVMSGKGKENFDKVSWDNKYPEEIKQESIEAMLRREAAKGPVHGHFM